MTGVSAPEGQLPGLAWAEGALSVRPPPELPPFLRLHAQIISDSDKIRWPLYPQKRTLKLSRVMSVLCQKGTFAFQHLLRRVLPNYRRKMGLSNRRTCQGVGRDTQRD